MPFETMERKGENTRKWIFSFTNHLPELFPKRQILNFSKLKGFADDNSKFHGNCGKFSKWVENTVGKGEIARYEQYLLFPQCFQMTCPADTKKTGLVWGRVKIYLNFWVTSFVICECLVLVGLNFVVW